MLNKLIRGNKYTIVGNDGWLEYKIQITLLDYMYRQWAQYEAVPYIAYKKKGGRKVQTLFLTGQYSIVEGWQDIKIAKDIDDNWQERLKYKDIDLNSFNIIVKGGYGDVEPYREYETLIDYSCNLIEKYGHHTEEYKRGLKEIFTKLNYSLSDDMISYYKQEHDYFLSSLEYLK